MSSISREKNRTALYETQRELYLSSRCNEEGERGQMTERCWRLRGELRGEQDHASTLEISHHLPSPSLKQKSKTFFVSFCTNR